MLAGLAGDGRPVAGAAAGPRCAVWSAIDQFRTTFGRSDHVRSFGPRSVVWTTFGRLDHPRRVRRWSERRQVVQDGSKWSTLTVLPQGKTPAYHQPPPREREGGAGGPGPPLATARRSTAPTGHGQAPSQANAAAPRRPQKGTAPLRRRPGPGPEPTVARAEPIRNRAHLDTHSPRQNLDDLDDARDRHHRVGPTGRAPPAPTPPPPRCAPARAQQHPPTSHQHPPHPPPPTSNHRHQTNQPPPNPEPDTTRDQRTQTPPTPSNGMSRKRLGASSRCTDRAGWSKDCDLGV